MTKESELVTKLTKKHYTISAAESCTGGLLAAAIVNVSGASRVFERSYVTYADLAKEDLVKVSRATLSRFGAVSSQTAEEMALGCAKAAGADVGLSTTGIAGPEGGTPDKPVGLVYIGCKVCGRYTVRKCLFGGDRAKIRENTVSSALSLMRECILQYYSEVTFGNKDK